MPVVTGEQGKLERVGGLRLFFRGSEKGKAKAPLDAVEKKSPEPSKAAFCRSKPDTKLR